MGAVIREAPDRRGSNTHPKAPAQTGPLPWPECTFGMGCHLGGPDTPGGMESPCLSPWPGLGVGVTPASCPQCELDPGHPHRLLDLSFPWRPSPWRRTCESQDVRPGHVSISFFAFLRTAPSNSSRGKGGDESISEALTPSSCHLWPQKRSRLFRAETARAWPLRYCQTFAGAWRALQLLSSHPSKPSSQK